MAVWGGVGAADLWARSTPSLTNVGNSDWSPSVQVVAHRPSSRREEYVETSRLRSSSA